MRAIKFKAKRLDGRGWVEGHYYRIKAENLSLVTSKDAYNKPLTTKTVSFDRHYILTFTHPDEFGWDIKGQTWLAEIDPSTLCQFTEIRDTKLWEHDIVFIPYSNRHYVVTYMDGCFKLVHHNADMKGMVWGTIERLIELGWDFTVTGNIHDKE